MESDEERAVCERGGEREIGRAAATRETRGGVGEDRKRKRETETDSVLDPPGIDAFVCQNAETPASFLPSFLPSLFSSLLCSSLPPPSYLTRLVVSLSLSLSLSLPVSLAPCPSLSRSFSRVSSSVLSRRAADADAGASGIAATVGGATTHTLHLFPFHPSPFSLSILSTLFEKQRRWPSAQRTRR